MSFYSRCATKGPLCNNNNDNDDDNADDDDNNNDNTMVPRNRGLGRDWEKGKKNKKYSQGILNHNSKDINSQ